MQRQKRGIQADLPLDKTAALFVNLHVQRLNRIHPTDLIRILFRSQHRRFFCPDTDQKLFKDLAPVSAEQELMIDFLFPGILLQILIFEGLRKKEGLCPLFIFLYNLYELLHLLCHGFLRF